MMLNIGCLFIITMRGNCLKRLFKWFRLTKYDTTIVNSILRNIKKIFNDGSCEEFDTSHLKKNVYFSCFEKKNHDIIHDKDENEQEDSKQKTSNQLFRD